MKLLPIDRTTATVGFDEYVIAAPAGRRSWRWTRRFLIGMSAFLFILGVVVSFPILYALWAKWVHYSGAFMATDWDALVEHKIPLGYYPWAQIYYSWAVPAGLLTLAILLFSACLITDQIEQDQAHARLAHMPAVFVRPQLKWTLIGVDKERLTAEAPRLSVEFFNIGDTPAMKLQLTIVDFYVNLRRSSWFSRRNCVAALKIRPEDRVAYFARLVPAGDDDKEGMTERLVKNHRFSILGPPASSPPFGELLQSFLAPSETDFPGLVLVMNIKFETIRGVKFDETLAVRWSGQACRAVGPVQRDKIRELELVVEATTRAGWRAHEPSRIGGEPQDLSQWTWLTLSPRVASARTGTKLKWGEKCKAAAN